MYKPLYQTQEEHAAIVNALLESEGEISPDLEFAMNINQDELEQKAKAYALRILEFNGLAEQAKIQAERMSARAAAYEKTSKRLKELISSAMKQFNCDKIKTDRVTLSFRKSESVEIPEGYLDHVLSMVTLEAKLDEKKLEEMTREAISAGKPVPAFPSEEVMEHLKLTASFNASKAKASIKEGVQVGDITIVEKKNLQIK